MNLYRRQNNINSNNYHRFKKLILGAVLGLSIFFGAIPFAPNLYAQKKKYSVVAVEV